MRAARGVQYDASLAERQEEIPALLGGARALVVRNRTQVTAALLDAAPALECVGRLGVGLDNIDMEACAARNVKVYPATGANNRSVAEYVVTALLTLLRGCWFSTGEILDGGWPRGRATPRPSS